MTQLVSFDKGVRNSATAAGCALLSRITGLVRLLVVGAVLGPTYLSNVFVTTNMVPNIMYTAIAGPVLTMVIVPAVVSGIARRGVPDTEVLLGRVTGFVLAGTAMLIGLLLIASPAIAAFLTTGVEIDADRRRAVYLTIVMLAFVAPQVALYAIIAICIAAQQARGRFVVPTAAPILENVGLIATMSIVAILYDTGTDINSAPIGLAVVLGLGSTVAVAMHATLQLIGAARSGLRIRPSRGWRNHDEVRDLVRRIGGSVVVALAPALTLLLVLALAGTVPGGALALQTAYAIYSVVVALGAQSVVSTALPDLSSAYDRGSALLYARHWRRALRYIATAVLPAVLLLTVFATPIARTLANGELRTTSYVAMLASTIGILGVAPLAAGMHELGRQALFARSEVVAPRRAATAGLVVTVALGLGCVLLVPDELRLAGLAVALVAADLTAAAVVLARVRAVIGPERIADVRELVRVLAAATCMAPVAVVGAALATAAPDRTRCVGVSFATALLGLVLFIGTLRLISPGPGGRSG